MEGARAGSEASSNHVVDNVGDAGSVTVPSTLHEFLHEDEAKSILGSGVIIVLGFRLSFFSDSSSLLRNRSGCANDEGGNFVWFGGEGEEDSIKAVGEIMCALEKKAGHRERE